MDAERIPRIDESSPDYWEESQNILVILAHPDDPEFFCGASIARWTSAGHQVSYCLLTCGDKGTKDRNLSSEELCNIRHTEQLEAAKVLGVTKVRFLDYPDGYLLPNLDLRKDITRIIRQDYQLMAKRAVELLMNRINGDVSTTKVELIKAEFIV